MERIANPPLAPVVRKLLWADATLEAAIAFVLFGFFGDPHEWLDVSSGVTLIAAFVFLAATVTIGAAAILRSTGHGFVQQLAVANIGGGVAVWVFALLNWDRFSNEGHALIAATGDAFILIGILEFFALRRLSPPD